MIMKINACSDITRKGQHRAKGVGGVPPSEQARDTHLGLTLLIMDCLEAKCLSPVCWPKQWHHLNKQCNGGGGGLASMLSAYFPPC